jgi:hypothetical protein
MAETPLPHTPHMRRDDLPVHIQDVLGAVETQATNDLTEYLQQKVRELNLSPAVEAALMAGVPRIVGASVDMIALDLVARERGAAND